MNNLKQYSDEQLVRLVEEGWVTEADFIDSGICPTCFSREHDNVLYGDISERILYENDEYQCFLVDRPRTDGHIIVISQNHYKNMVEADDSICEKLFVFAKKVMNCMKMVYGCESVYLCTMCDGPMNHFHVELIPRYCHENVGSDIFVKYRIYFLNLPL